MRPRKIGERIIIGNRIAVVQSKVARNSGVQEIRYEDKLGLLGGVEWRDWRHLVTFPDAPQPSEGVE